MSDEEFEKFEVTDNDLATEFNPNRFRKNFSKNQQTYGIWAADSDEEEAKPRRGFGLSSGTGERSGYNGPISFISAGIQKPDKSKEAAAKDKDEEPEDDEGPDISDSSSEDEMDVIITKSIMGQKKMSSNIDMNQLAGMRKKSGGGGGVSKGIEMYGLGAKMAMKMGYEPGKGLGKDLQGIAAPIEAHKRKGRGAIGAYGREGKSKIADSILDEQPAGKSSSQQPPPTEHKWQKDGNKRNKNEKIEYQYVTAEDVLKQKHVILRPDAGSLAKVKVIDLTGPQQRILSGYHAISGQQKPKDEWEGENQQQEAKFTLVKKPAFEMPELLHNINLLKDSCEQDILRNEKKLKYARERKETLANEIKEMNSTILNESQLITNLDTLINKVKILHETPNMNLDLAFISLGTLKREYPEEWELHQLYNLVPAITIPLLKSHLKLWNPLESPQMPVQLFTDWANLLGSRGDIFEWIIWETWMPSIRSAISYWNVKDADSLLNVFEAWTPLLANWIVTNLLDQFILPKMKDGVDSWDPLSDPVPIHGWLHPWLPHLGCKLEIVYPTIREKLSNALTKWHPCDESAKKILTPWVNVFTKGSMDAFLLKNIVPKLHQAMQKLIITPHCPQNLEPWNWVMDWLDMVPVKAIVHILETVFFPNWLQFLVNWLSHMPNFEEVYRWYKWWREVFPQELSRDPTVTTNLKKALEMISRAVQNPGQPLDMMGGGPPPPPTNIPQMPMPMGSVEVMADAMRMTAQVPQSFRDLVQMKCEEIGLLFLPVPNKYYEAKQVYRCGNVFVYISANVIFVLKDGAWQPTSLNQLIQAATG